MSTVLSNAGPLIVLGKLNRLDLLETLYQQIGSDAMWVIIENGQVIEFAQTSEVFKTSEV